MSQRKVKRARREARARDELDATVRKGGYLAGNRRTATIVLAALVLAALVGGVLAARGHGPAQPSKVSHGRDGAIDFSGTDPVSGKHVSLADYRGRPVVINVWGSWCPGCRDEARDLASFAAAHPEAQVIGVDLQDTTGGAKSFYRTYGWRHPSVFDPRGKIASSLGLQGTPTTYFLDRQHRLVTQIVGATNLAGFEQGFRAVTRS